MAKPDTERRRATTRGFQSASKMLGRVMKHPFEKRGFAEAKLLTHWDEIVGPEIAAIARPVKVSHGRGGGLGGTLVLLTTGAQAPVLEMQKEQIKDRVNACYGYRAVARVQITQTAATGFAEGQVTFSAKPKPPEALDPNLNARAEAATADVTDPELRGSLTALAKNVLGQTKN